METLTIKSMFGGATLCGKAFPLGVVRNLLFYGRRGKSPRKWFSAAVPNVMIAAVVFCFLFSDLMIAASFLLLGSFFEDGISFSI